METTDGSVGDKLTSAAAKGDSKEVNSLLENGVQADAINKFGRTALQVMQMGHSIIAKSLLKAGAKPNQQDHGGFTPAHDAAREGFLDTLKTLVDFGANVNIENSEGNLPIHLAAQEGHTDVVTFLAKESNLTFKNENGQTPYELAQIYKRTETMQWMEQNL
ncbi:cyclin-dependent kinase 4 inhibitor C [Amblyraja radiata]|uniref:cyclin-dependent kinase 4 inhibitor C n=1 Tax=Amblyraja radiata TaxID=386614 RepID=UPI001403D255|nr:cyclin-dependent kinase 4 inhibitor C [Amblyraja radiata]XP_055497774.1 cyclin-dependent kinase 4 inhibitor C isoform X1 [Leucoraja erinacea]